MKQLIGSRSVLSCAVAAVCVFTVACGTSTFNDPPGVATTSVANTQNPLVASVTVATALGCTGEVGVEFGLDTSYGRSTAWYPATASLQKTTILVAGMKASSTYHMRAQAQCSNQTTPSFFGSDTTFKTGPLPAIAFPTMTVTRPNPSLSSQESPGVEVISIPLNSTPALITDRDANPIWYYDVGTGSNAFPFKLLPNGDMIVNIVTTSSGSLLREIDLAGNTIRDLSIYTLQTKLQAMGADFVPAGYHHDILPLANGHVIVLLDCFKNFTDLPGYPGTTAVQGDALVDLDQNWNPVWMWNSFDYLDVNRHLNGLPDWTHSNALVYLPNDGNLLLSIRHQSWVIKIDYNNGTGDGHILWRLGYEGDFALTQNGIPTTDPSLWFSFQHFPVLLSQNGSKIDLAIWDNGDNRVLTSAGELCIDPRTGNSFPACYSRATLFQVDEGAMVADLSWGDSLPYYGVWGGSINQMANGNVEYDLNAPAIPPSTGVGSEVQEVTQTSSPQVIWQMDINAPAFAYRAYRVPSLYNGITWQY